MEFFVIKWFDDSNRVSNYASCRCIRLFFFLLKNNYFRFVGDGTRGELQLLDLQHARDNTIAHFELEENSPGSGRWKGVSFACIIGRFSVCLNLLKFVNNSQEAAKTKVSQFEKTIAKVIAEVILRFRLYFFVVFAKRCQLEINLKVNYIGNTN